MEKVAVIDLGSNSLRMIIMQIRPDMGFKMLEETKLVVRLSHDMGKERKLKEPAIQNTIEGLKLLQKIIQLHGVTTVISVATAALRIAVNREEVCQRIEKETGISFQIISGEQEAYYGYLGVISTMAYEDFLLMDIGGGSVEISEIRGKKLMNTCSIPLGAVTLTERHQTEEISKKIISESAFSEIEGEIEKLSFLELCHGLPLIGIGGTNRTLGKLNSWDREYPLQTLHGYKIEIASLERILDTIERTSKEELAKIEGINKKRAEVLHGGILPLKALLKKVELSKFVISAKGVREGVFYEHYFDKIKMQKKWTEEVSLYSLRNFLKNAQLSEFHAETLWKLSKEILRGMDSFFEVSEKEKFLLRCACYAHDFGMSIDYYNHHQHSFYLILNSNLNGFSHDELVKIAFLSGMHRTDKKLKENWQKYHMLITESEYELCKKLSVILMLAEKLDRTESDRIEKLHVTVQERRIQLTLWSSQNISLEIEGAQEVCKYFKKAFGKDLILSFDESIN